MLLLLVSAIMAAMLVLTEMHKGRSQGMIRSYAMLGGCAAVGISGVPNIWLQGLLFLMLVNLLRDPNPGMHLARALPLFVLVLTGVLIYREMAYQSRSQV